MTKSLFCFGLGYVGLALARSMLNNSWTVSGTCRTKDKADELRSAGIDAFVFGEEKPAVSDLQPALSKATHIISTIPAGTARSKPVPPDQTVDPVLRHAGSLLRDCSNGFAWVGYLSNASVYGDYEGAWVDETMSPRPRSTVAKHRLRAETEWLGFGESTTVPVHVFRLASIYGPHRSALTRVKAGKAKNVVKEGQYVSQIHVDDIVEVVKASMASPNAGRIYNVSDDHTSLRGKSLVYAAELLGVTPPPEIPFDQMQDDPIVRRYFSENKRLSNQRIHEELGINLHYPSYREGFRAIYEAGQF